MDVNTIATYTVYFVSAFMFLPAGRDIFAPGKAILPGDDKLLAIMSPKSQTAFNMVWNLWGLNWCVISAMKILAVSGGADAFVKLGFVADLLAFAIMLKEKGSMAEGGGDITPFLALFAIELLALGALAFM